MSVLALEPLQPSPLRQLGWLMTGLITLWASAPPTNPPPVPASAPLDLGIAGSLGPDTSSTCIVTDAAGDRTMQDCPRHVDGISVAAGTFWIRRRFSRRFELSGVAGGGEGVGAFLGAHARYFFVDRERLRVGGAADLGLLWVGFGLPAAWALTPRIWLTTEPSLASRGLGLARLPVGLAVELSPRTRLSTELTLATGGMDLFSTFGGLNAWISLGISTQP